MYESRVLYLEYSDQHVLYIYFDFKLHLQHDQKSSNNGTLWGIWNILVFTIPFILYPRYMDSSWLVWRKEWMIAKIVHLITNPFPDLSLWQGTAAHISKSMCPFCCSETCRAHATSVFNYMHTRTYGVTYSAHSTVYGCVWVFCFQTHAWLFFFFFFLD